MPNLPKVTLPEDQHPVGEFCSDGSYKPLGVAIRSRAAWRDLHHADACVGQHRIERGGELAGSIPLPPQDRAGRDQPMPASLDGEHDAARRAWPGRPSADVVEASSGAAQRPRVAARAARHPWTPTTVQARPTSQTHEPRSSRASAWTRPTIMHQRQPLAVASASRPTSGTPQVSSVACRLMMPGIACRHRLACFAESPAIHRVSERLVCNCVLQPNRGRGHSDSYMSSRGPRTRTTRRPWRYGDGCRASCSTDSWPTLS
jgi:hypothetical protein